MSHPANSIAPLPSFASAPKDAAALAQLAAAVAAANTPAPEPAALLGGGAQSSEPREPTPQELGTVFSSPYPQLLPLRAEHEAHIVKAYTPFFEHLPYVAYTDVLLSFPAAAASPYAGLQWTGRIAVAPTAPGSAHLEISAVQALTGAPHFCLDSAEGEGFIPAGLFLGSASPLPLTPDNLHALASAIRSAFLSPTRVPPQLTASFNSCPHCEGCNTYARSAKHYLGERALALGCARAFASAPPAGLSPAALQLASSIIAFPVLPTLALPAPLALPQVPAWPTGAASLAAFEGMLDPALLGALQAAASGADPTAAGLASLLHQEVPGWIYSFPMFTPEACEALLGVTEAHEGFCTAKGLHVQRPNSMNRYGVILRSIGLGAFVNSLTAALLAPIMSACFPLEGLQGGGCSSQHAFIVAYDAEEGKDKLLDMHTDDAECVPAPCLGQSAALLAPLLTPIPTPSPRPPPPTPV